MPAAKQKEALELLLAALAPENLDISDRIVADLVAEPSGRPASREHFASDAGATFSPLSAARSLAALVVNPLLDPERAARLSLVSGGDALDFDALLRRLVAATWGAPPDASSRLAALRRVGQRSVLEAMMALAANPAASPEVRATILARLTRLRADLKLRKGAGAVEAHLRLAERDLSEFLDRPESRKAPARPPVPPGRPIG